MIQLIPPERFNEVQRAMRDEAPPPPRVVNVENALHLHEPEVLEFRGLCWPVEPISGPEGLKLMALADALEAARQSGAGALLVMHAKITDFMWRLVKRPNLLRRLFPARNPLRRATMLEVAHLLNFFARLQMTSSVRYRFQRDGSPTATTRN